MNTRTKKHIPLRTCIGCRRQKEKKELIRVVRSPEGTFTVDDAKGRQDGRGAYVCADVNCFEKAQKKNAFSHVFKIKLSVEDMDNIKAGFIKRLVHLTERQV